MKFKKITFEGFFFKKVVSKCFKNKKKFTALKPNEQNINITIDP